MDASGLGAGLELVTGVVPDLMGLVTTFPINLFAVMLVASLAFVLIRKLIKVFKKR